MFVNLDEAALHSRYVERLSANEDDIERKTSSDDNYIEHRRRTSDKLEFKEVKEFSAEDFVEKLLTEGSNVSCDETASFFNVSMQLPPYYNKNLYKRGQNFFFKHIFGLFLSKLLGLILMLALPTLKILIMTNMSDTPLKAYRRYVATVFHMCVWYWHDLEPGSKLWTSIEKVKAMHNSASKKSNAIFKYRISQKEMALTQFGFMGFSLTRSEAMGIHNATDEEWKAFIHLWRVVGYILGIEDRFNICRESVAETREICHLLIEKEFLKAMENTDKDFDRMSKALIEGMWAMNPILCHDTFIYLLHMVLGNSKDIDIQRGGLQLRGHARRRLEAIIFFMSALRYTAFRIFLKYVQLLSLWLMKTFPFLAYYKFGKAKSHVVVDGY